MSVSNQAVVPVAAAKPAPAPAPTPVPVAATPVVTQTSTAPAVQDQHVTLVGQLQAVDPTIYAALVSVLVLPFVHQGIKALAKRASKKISRPGNYLLATFLSGVVGLLLTLQNSGALTQLHSPLLAAVLYTGISFICGQNVYGLYVKTRSELDEATTTSMELPEDAALPATVTP